SANGVVYSNVDTPAFKGTGTNGDKVQLTLTGPDNYSKVFNTVVAGGTWTLTVSPALPKDGDYTWSMTASDAAGNISPEVGGEFKLDTTPPTLTSVALDASSDSGFEQDDGITQDNTPTFNIVGEAGSKAVLKLWSGDSTSGTPQWTSSEMTIPESGTISITNSNTLNDGNYVWVVVLTDVAGNTSSSEQQTLIIDTVAPSLDSFTLVSDTGVSASDNITKDNTPLFSGVAEKGSRVQLQVKNSSNNEVTISPAYVTVGADGNWSYQLTSQLPDGVYTIKATATDAAGNTTESSSITVNIDTTPPVLSDVALSDVSDSGFSDTDGITNVSTPSFVGTTEVGATVTIVIKKEDETVQTLSTVVTNANGSWSVASQALEEGTYTWTAIATDVAGNVSEKSTGQLVIDTSIESFTVALASEDDTGHQNDDAITNKTDVSLSGSAEAGAKVTLKSLTFGGNSIDISSVLVASVVNNVWTISLPNLTQGDGVYSYTVEIEDIAGNKSTKNGSLTIDTSKPTLVADLDSLADSGSSSNDGVTNNTTPTFSGSVNETSTVVLKIFQDDSLVASYGPITTSNSWSIPVTTQLEDGQYTWRVEAVDVAGNIESISKSLTIDTTPPSLTAALDSVLDTGESSSDGITKEQNLKFKGTVGGEGSSSVTLRFEFGLVGATASSSQQTITSGNEFEFAANAPSDGTYSWKVTAVDIAGNEVEKTGTVVVDTQIQDFSSTTGLDTSSDLGSSDQDGISSDKTPSFVGKTEANAKVSLVMTLAGISVVNTDVQANDEGNFFITVPSSNELVDGTYTWTIQATDLAGNTKNKSGTYILDTTPPNVDFALDNDTGSDDDDWITNNNSLSISGTSDDPAEIKITLISGTTPLDTKNITPSSGVWTYSYPTDLDDGRYTLRVESTDIAGNTFSTSKELVIDTVVLNQFKLDSDSGSLDNDQITNAQKLVFSGQTDTDATLRLTVKNFDGDTLYSYTPTVNADTGQWSYEFPDVLDEGQYKIVVTATDVAGNTNTSVDYDVTIDRTPPILSGIQLDSDYDTGLIGDWVTETQQVSISGQTSIGSIVKVYISGVDSPITAGVSASGVFTAELPELSFGVHTLTIISMDIAGNAIEKTQTLTISPDILPFTAGLDLNSDSGDKGDNVTNIPSPVISGMGTPGYTVEATIDGVTYTATINEVGEWSFQIPVSLPDGNHKIEFVLVDENGDRTTQEPYEFVIDTTVDTTLQLDLDSDSGQKGDFITNAQNISLVGSTDESGVNIIIEDKTTGDVLADFVTTQGSWRYVFDDLPEGSHDFVMKLVDKAGNSNSHEFSITVDRTAPVLTVKVGDSSDVGSLVSQSKNQVFSGTVSDGTASLILSINGNDHAATINSDGTWSLELNLNEGINNFIVKAEDVAGNSTSIQGVINIKTSIRFNMEVENDNGQFDTDNILSGTKIIVGGNGGVGDIVELTLTNSEDEEKANVTLTIPSSGIWQHEFTGLADGTYTVAAAVRDDAGNTLERELDNIIVDNTNEGFSAQVLDESGIVDDNIISTEKPTFKGAGEIGSIVTIVVGDLTFNTQVNSSGTWQFQLSEALSDGTYEAVIYSIDRAGNRSPDQTIEFTVDSRDPIFSYEIEGAVTNGSVQYLNASKDKMIFKGNASEAGKVTIHINNMEFTQELSSSGAWQIEVGQIVEREHPYTISFEDVAGNTVTQTGTITVDRTIQAFVDLDHGSDTHAPTVGQTGDNYTSRKELTFTFNRLTSVTDKDITASVVISGPNGYSLEVNDINVSSAWRLPEPLPTDGDYVFNWSFVDNAGNTTSSTVRVTVDSHIEDIVAEDFMFDDVSMESNESLALNKQLVSLRFTPTTSSEYVVLRVSVGGQSYDAIKFGSTFVVPGLPLNKGDNSVTFTVWDRAGNSSSITQNIYVKTDFDKLELSIEGIEQTELDNIADIYSNADGREISLNGAVDIGSSFTVMVDHQKVYEGSVDESGEWSYQLELSEGLNKVTINFVDIAGNTESVLFNVVIDTVAPIMTVDSIDGEGYGIIGGENVLRGESVTLQGRIDAGSLITSMTLNGTLVTLGDDVLSNGRWTVEVSDLVEGKNTVVFVSKDAAGNTSTETIEVIRDSKVSDFTVSLNDDAFVSDVSALSGTVEVGSSMSVELLASDDSRVYAGTVSIDEDGNWSVPAPTQSLDDGQYTWKIVAHDLAGNELTREVSFTLDTVAPDAPTISLSDD
ncbi:Ig-like domain-containing protein, partial [Vibrio owensii]